MLLPSWWPLHQSISAGLSIVVRNDLQVSLLFSSLWFFQFQLLSGSSFARVTSEFEESENNVLTIQDSNGNLCLLSHLLNLHWPVNPVGSAENTSIYPLE